MSSIEASPPGRPVRPFSRSGGVAAIAAGAVVLAAVVLVPMLLSSLWLKVLTSASIYAVASSGGALLYAPSALFSLMPIAPVSFTL